MRKLPWFPRSFPCQRDRRLDTHRPARSRGLRVGRLLAFEAQMSLWAKAAAALLAILLALAGLPAHAESRFALVIGNAAYKGAPRLATPPNDAQDIAAALKSLGFKVTVETDLDMTAMQHTIHKFALESAEADVALFYYAGHGLQLAGRNYLVPIDAQLHNLGDVASQTVALDPVLAELGKGKGKGSHLVFLDACRNNLASASFAIPTAGLARVE